LILRKILIANRGEIAVRVIRTCRQMGLRTVAVYSEVDRAARHVRLADQACAIGGSPPVESYLRIDRLLDAARSSGADAVHPGYGFLSEQPAFAAACRDAGLTFIGPSAESMTLMGSKTAARRTAAAAGVPVVPGTAEPLPADVPFEPVAALAGQIGYPLLVKAVAGGGGKGMRVVRDAVGLEGAIRAARSEAGTAFGDAAVYLERQLVRPRHVEVQLLADAHGTILPFVERECSIQRRHQKLVEETPSLAVSAVLRRQLADAAVAVAREAGYTNAGTIEFLLGEDGRVHFLEMNTRLQVEHPITEAVTSVDLVEWQIRIARGEPLSLEPERLLTPRGHAIECRIYAEDADAGFLPSPGRISAIRAPGGPGIRDDSGVDDGGEVPVFYDPLISKLVAWGDDRARAVARMRGALQEYQVRGVSTTVPFFEWLFRQPAFQTGSFHTEYVDEVLHQRAGRPFVASDVSLNQVALIAAALAFGEEHAPGPRPAHRGEAIGACAATAPEGTNRWAAAGSAWTRRGRLEALRT
jgi:acetyl-CoA carboxylase biotin carboxylase subunit